MPLPDDEQPTVANTSKRVCLGRIAAPHGIKGLVKILAFGEDPYLIEDLGPCYTSEDGEETLAITLKNSLGKYILAEAEGSVTRNDSEALKGTDLYVDKDALPPIEDEGSFYFNDLIGLRALNAKGKEAGVVIAVHNFGAGDLLEVRPPSGDTYLLPFTDENVPEVDIDGGFVTVVPLEGL
jgi:16S rRNA processing protein RimM